MRRHLLPFGLSPSRFGLLALTLCLGLPAFGAKLPEGALERRCWLEHTRDRTRVNLLETKSVEFTTLRDGMSVRSPFVVDFAVYGMGVAPAGIDLAGTGHHHLLVNRDLPMDVRGKLPFDDSHRHYGKGQTAALLDLPPGRHRLRLLFADHEHRPFYVYSREIAVQVRGPRNSTERPRIDPARFPETCAAWYADELSSPPPADEPLRFVNVRANEPLVSPFNLRLGVQKFGVCAAPPNGAAKPENTGHFIVDVLNAQGKRVRVFDLKNGATQVNVSEPAGDYLLRLRFVDSNGTNLLPPHELPVFVTRNDEL